MPVLLTHYNAGLIVVSVLISMGASYAALTLADRMRVAETAWQRRFWKLGGSLAMGGGIWSMHYLGMLAVKLPVDVYYYWPMVLLSLLMAVIASLVAFSVVSADQPGWQHLLAGGALMGAGIGTMHYLGMAAMRSTAMHHYNPWIVAVSLVAAVGFSWMSLWIAFAVRDGRKRGSGMLQLAGGAVMGLGIASMHYIAMSAVTFMPDVMEFSLEHTVRVNVLGQTGIAVMTGLILLAALGTAAMDKRRFQDLAVAHAELEEAQRELLESQERLRQVNDMLSELSIRDALTGLFNRRHFDASLGTEWRRAARRGVPIALLMIDVDNFKALNDKYGHQRGDDCLREVARVLEAGPRRGHDVVARYGGEEFVVLLPDADEAAALMIGEIVRKSVQKAGIAHPGSPGGVLTVSVGACSRKPLATDEPAGIVRGADAALYSAKRFGRNRVELAVV